jgi:hypothetical protein
MVKRRPCVNQKAQGSEPREPMGWPAATVGFTFCDLWRLQDAPQATLYHGRDLSVQKRQAARTFVIVRVALSGILNRCGISDSFEKVKSAPEFLC